MGLNGNRLGGFTLPTVLIASVVMLAVLATTLQLVSATSASLRDQYYNQLAREAAEAGNRMVETCWGSGTTMTTSIVLTPATNCVGAVQSGRSAWIVDGNGIRTTFAASITSTTTGAARAQVTGTTNLLNQSNSSVSRSFTSSGSFQRILTTDAAGDRASQRFWYFGPGGGLDFGTSGTALPTLSYPANRMVPTSGVSIDETPGAGAFEGSTVVTNKKGQLVFWSDGRKIWNKNGEEVESGLLGSSSATQAVAAFPLNQAQTRYGIVSNTTGYAESSYTGSPFTAAQKWRLYFSEYDITLNGGKGGVVSGRKNVDIYSGYSNASYGGNGYASEALNAIPNHDGTGYWVYTYSKDVAGATNGNRVLGFLIGVDGNVKQRVSYNLPTLPTLCGTAPGRSTYGTINFSADYTKMLIMIGTSGCQSQYPLTDANRQNSGTVYIVSVNRQSGALTQQKAWITRANSPYTDPNPRPSSTGAYPRNSGYSADFSPSGTFVYVTQLYPGWLTRYDATVADPGSTQHTMAHTSRGTPTTGTANNTWNGGGQIRRGPDGRMYISSNPYSGTYPVPAASNRNQIICITNPDAVRYATLETMGYQNPCTGVNLGTAYSWYGLPQMVTVYVPEVIYY